MTTYTAIYCPFEACTSEGCPFNHNSRLPSRPSTRAGLTSLPNQNIKKTRSGSPGFDSTLSSLPTSSELSDSDLPWTKRELFGLWVDSDSETLFAPRNRAISIGDIFSPKAAGFASSATIFSGWGFTPRIRSVPVEDLLSPKTTDFTVIAAAPSLGSEDILDLFEDLSVIHGADAYSRLSSRSTSVVSSENLNREESTLGSYMKDWNPRYQDASHEEQKMMLGDYIFYNIERLEPEYADKITRLLIATMENDDLFELTTDRTGLLVEVEEAKGYIAENPVLMHSPHSYWVEEHRSTSADIGVQAGTDESHRSSLRDGEDVFDALETSSIYSYYYYDEDEEDHEDCFGETFEEWHIRKYGYDHSQAVQRRSSCASSIWSNESEIEDECLYCEDYHLVHECDPQIALFQTQSTSEEEDNFFEEACRTNKRSLV